jgi:5-methyltetrahydrofolate--homocysteine methyltransferase
VELEYIQKAIIDGDMLSVVHGVEDLLAGNTSPNDILVNAMIPAMTEVGNRFEQGVAYVAEMLISARAMKAGLELIKPLLASSGIQPLARIALGTVHGDLHDIGKNLAGMKMEGLALKLLTWVLMYLQRNSYRQQKMAFKLLD